MKLALAVLLVPAAIAQSWVTQNTDTTASLRGVSAVDPRVVWASGSSGTWLRTVDGGSTWKSSRVPGAEQLDFRGVRAIDSRRAYLMSSGPGALSRVYKTADSGEHWKVLFTNPDVNGFFDALAFWDEAHGIIAGDAVDGHVVIFTTSDGGRRWIRQRTPPALPNEGAFAASNSCLTVRGKREAWIGTNAARVFHSMDRGKSWTVADTPIRHDRPSAGIFSIAFSTPRHGVAVGGDYEKDKEAGAIVAVTNDGGLTWKAPSEGPSGFRSAVKYLPDIRAWISVGTSGSDISEKDGETWKRFDDGSWNALAWISSKAVWAVGAKGRIAKFNKEGQVLPRR